MGNSEALPHGSVVSVDADHHVIVLSVKKAINIGFVARDTNDSSPATAG